eukprot:SAG22_NODE_11949_length_462_cov_1.165289_1_plen_92_part_00
MISSGTCLFQGDSITDCGRSRTNDEDLGRGYPHFISGGMAACAPKAGVTFLNRGISGNRIVDLDARIKSDVINLTPDLLSVLIAVNDTWHE